MSNDVTVVQGSALEAINRSEVMIAVELAKKYPRDQRRIADQIVAQACADEDTAASMLYSLSRQDRDGGGKTIEGPGVRLAEIAVRNWGNSAVSTRIVEVGDTYVAAQGVGFDLEKNQRWSVEVRRRITGKGGKRYSDDMIMTTCNAATSIALRQVAFKMVPSEIVNKAYEAAKRLATGDEAKLSARRDKAIKRFGVLGVPLPALLSYLGRKSADEINVGDLTRMIGTYNRICDGETTVGAEFGISSEQQNQAQQDENAAQPAPISANGSGKQKGAQKQTPKQQLETLKLKFRMAGKTDRFEAIVAAAEAANEIAIGLFDDGDYTELLAQLSEELGVTNAQ